MDRNVVIVGSYCKGLFTKGSRLPRVGETVIHDRFFEGPGGKGSNQAVAAAKLGTQTQLLACVGDDAWGREAIEMYHIIKPNETEAALITGQNVSDVESAFRAGDWFLKRGVGLALITLGARGSVLVGKEHKLHFPAPSVMASDTTGAGDVFSGAFLAECAAGTALEEAIRFASHAAALSTTRLGVIDAIPDRASVLAHMKQDVLCKE